MTKIVRHDPGIIDAEFKETRHTPLLARVIGSRRISPERTAYISSHQQRDECCECSMPTKGAMDAVIDAAMFTAKLILVLLIGITALGAIAGKPHRTAAPQAACKP